LATPSTTSLIRDRQSLFGLPHYTRFMGVERMVEVAIEVLRRIKATREKLPA
jgi:hypothetical protein